METKKVGSIREYMDAITIEMTVPGQCYSFEVKGDSEKMCIKEVLKSGLYAAAGEAEFSPYHKFNCVSPEKGCAFFFYLTSNDGLDSRGLGWQAFVFDGEKWKRLPRHQRVGLYKDQFEFIRMQLWIGNGEAIESRRPNQGVGEEEIFQFWTGELSLSDVLIVDQRIRLRPKLQKALESIQKTKGAIPQIHSRELVAVEQSIWQLLTA